jgi:hypothetical protein
LPVTTLQSRKLHQVWVALGVLLLASSAWAEVTLVDRYQALKDGGSTTLPGTTISVTSTQQGVLLSADVSSILHTPFAAVSASLAQAQNWCQFMPLHFNIKACTYQRQEEGELLTLYSGRKYYQSPEESYAMDYHFENLQQDDTRLTLHLSADHGPAGTRDYRIEVDALPVAEGTMLHIHSAYRPSMLSSMLTRGYLTTLGRDKVGFSRTRQGEELLPVQGLRGVVERNVMRYQLAIEAFLDSQPLAENSRHEAALISWFRQNDSYSLQLHEMSEADYLNIKHQEWQNQQRLQQAMDAGLQLAEAP